MLFLFKFFNKKLSEPKCERYKTIVNGFVAEDMGQTVSSASSFLWDAQTDLQGYLFRMLTDVISDHYIDLNLIQY